MLEEFAMSGKNLVRALLAGWLVLVTATLVSAAVKLPAVFGDNMVLQQGCSVPVWGWATSGDEVTVSLAGQKQTARTGADGRWQVKLSKLEANGGAAPLEMTVQDSSGKTIKFKNIAVGEVWVCSGQSNMEIGIGGCDHGKEEIAAAKYPQIRLFTVPWVRAPQPAQDVLTGMIFDPRNAWVRASQPTQDVHAVWYVCSPQTVSKGGWTGFSAAAYFFGRTLHQKLNVPVGLIHTSLGGTPAEHWTSRKALEAEPLLRSLAGQDGSSTLYNGMISPLIPFAIRGVIWYQGESNVGRAMQYRTLLPAMIRNWRTDWGQGDFPFGIVQIAPCRYGSVVPCAELWEAQLLTVKRTPHTGLAVTTDLGLSLHPTNKQDVGRRLGLWALATVYGQKLVYSGPIYQSMTVEGDKVRLTFDHVGSGLASRDGKPLTDFVIAGADKKFHPATAAIDGATLVVQSSEVPHPQAVRFAWHEDAQPNFINKDGLPASPFGTDQEQ